MSEATTNASDGSKEPNDDNVSKHETERSDDRTDTLESGEPGYEELVEELERLRAEVTRLRARQAAAERDSWFHRHPVLAVLVTSTLGAAAGYVAGRIGAPSDGFSDRTRRQLEKIAEQARDVASDVQREIESRTGAFRQGTETDAGGDGVATGTATPEIDASNGTESSSAVESMSGKAFDRLAGTAQEASQSVRQRARSATRDAAARAVRSFSSDDDVVPVELKARAAGMAATTLGAALARKLLRSAGRIGTSMLLAYLTKKLVDAIRGR
ncbi:MAG: hypothetical protein GVY25_11935 [Bacteroidetes bacterium]|jgi:ElaB/YqjD/DUF883 family membrane-anchored ribosome-binding protein|nr:hypothetical protein [Bacteroidota bacterium]